VDENINTIKKEKTLLYARKEVSHDIRA